MKTIARSDDPTGQPSAALPDDLLATLRQYLELEVRRLQRQEREVEAQARHDAVVRDVGQMITWAFLLAVYAAVVAILSQRALLDALLVPAQLPGLVEQRVAGSLGLYSSIPDSIRALLLPLATSAVLLMFRCSPMKLRTNLSGLFFAALFSLALLGLSASVISPPWGSLASIVGFVAATAILYVFARTLIKIDALETDGKRRPAEQHWPWMAAVDRRWRALRRRLHPGRDRWTAAAFVLVPAGAAAVLAIDAMTASDLTKEDPLKMAGQIGFVLWAVWGVVATPAAARVALWAPAACTLWIGWIVALGAVALIYFTTTLAVLMTDVGLLALRRAEGSER